MHQIFMIYLLKIKLTSFIPRVLECAKNKLLKFFLSINGITIIRKKHGVLRNLILDGAGDHLIWYFLKNSTTKIFTRLPFLLMQHESFGLIPKNYNFFIKIFRDFVPFWDGLMEICLHFRRGFFFTNRHCNYDVRRHRKKLEKFEIGENPLSNLQ